MECTKVALRVGRERKGRRHTTLNSVIVGKGVKVSFERGKFDQFDESRH